MRALLLACSVLIIGLVTAPAARACTCAPNPPPREALEGADAVFVMLGAALLRRRRA